MKAQLESFKERSRALDTSDLDLTRFRDQPLPADALRCLRYMHDVEFHTICYLRDLLMTPAHQDPDITAFLTFWSYEEYWHGEALASVLAAHGETVGAARIEGMRRRLPIRDRLSPFIQGAVSWLTGPSFVAVHMAWGAVNEWTTQAGYARLSALNDHPVLRELLSRIMKQEGRHVSFYAGQAQQRLSESPRARRLTRTALKRLWSPVGAGVMPEEEVAFLARYLFGGTEGADAARRIDRQIDRLPGVDGLRLVSTAIEGYTALAA